MGGIVWQSCKSSVISQTKTIQNTAYVQLITFWLILIRQTFCQILETVNSPIFFVCQTFPYISNYEYTTEVSNNDKSLTMNIIPSNMASWLITVMQHYLVIRQEFSCLIIAGVTSHRYNGVVTVVTVVYHLSWYPLRHASFKIFVNII